MLNRIVIFGLLISLGSVLGSQQAIAAPTCSDELTAIVPQMLTDLPSYGNRVIQRSRNLKREEDTFGYVLTVSPADFRPIPLRNQQFTPTVPDTTQQIFFTTLEKQYIHNVPITSENFYWLFLTPTKQGWAIANLFSSIGNLDTTQLAAPPQDANLGVIGQATKLWLRDFNAHCELHP